MASTSRSRPRGRPARAAPRSPSPAQSQSESTPSDSDSDSDLENSLNYPLPTIYNTTFSAHRVSPLHLGKEERLSSARLQTLSQRLRDLLVGDVVRGVEVGLGSNGEDASGGVMGRAGALEAVGIRWVRLGKVLGIETVARGGGEDEEEGGDGGTDRNWWRAMLEGLKGRRGRALHIVLRYENAECAALLLPELGGGVGENGEGGDQMRFWVGDTGGGGGAGKGPEQPSRFLNMPLLLLRMPGPLKAVICDFLAVSFDCRVSNLRLGTRSMVRSWESWIRTVGLPSRGPLAKDVALSLGFYLPLLEKEKGSGELGEGEQQPVAEEHLGLRSIDIIISAAELRKFVDAGSELSQNKRKAPHTPPLQWGWENDLKKRRKLAGRLYEEGWEWRKLDVDADDASPLEEQPFTEALGHYIDKHLGLNLFHPSVRVTKIACGGFVMSEARLKVFAPANLRADDSATVTASSPGQRGAVLELLSGLAEKASIRPGEFL